MPLLPLLLAAFAPAARAAEVVVFTLSTGVAIQLPPVEALDCASMRRMLDAIDQTGYRRGGPIPNDAADMALLDYENRLSRSFYRNCVRLEVLGRPTGAPHPLRSSGQ